MSLVLSIENESRLPDGGPLRVEVFGRGLDVGRDQHLDWTLPDPSRFISGKHCEIRYRDHAYWLYDVSTNGTFLNGADGRVASPHRLRDGDRLAIGHYIVKVTIDEDAMEAAAPAAEQGAARPDLWGAAGEVAPTADRRDFAPRHVGKPAPDFLDWAIDVDRPAVPAAPPFPARAAAEPRLPPATTPWDPPPAPVRPAAPPIADDWYRAPPPPAEPTPPPAIQAPTPRRPAARPAIEDAFTAPVAPAPTVPASAWDDLPTPAGPEPARMPPTPPGPPAPVTAQPVAPPPPPASPPSLSSPTPSAPATGGDLLQRLARAAGIPDDVIARRAPEELADEVGAVLRLTVENLQAMLAARAETKSLVRSGSRTMVRAFDNNPLKFSPTAEDALRIMFGGPHRSYLDGRRAVAESFQDLKRHQVETYSAMQGALEALFEDLSPEAIEKSAGPDKGLGGLVGSRKARLWDIFAERWREKTGRSDGRLVDAFMRLFAECYDRLQGRGP